MPEGYQQNEATIIVGVDFSKSNDEKGKYSFGGNSLHSTHGPPNSYESVMRLLDLSVKIKNNKSQFFGFADASTGGNEVFSFYANEEPCGSFLVALERYRVILPYVKFAEPTSFGPIIEKAMNIVHKNGGGYHVLFIISDGQITSDENASFGVLSFQEKKTMEAITKASEYPLSIIVIGVGDGPWDIMHSFAENIPDRTFSNFKFINFREIYSEPVLPAFKEARFSSAVLQEIDKQYEAIVNKGLFGRKYGKWIEMFTLPPPCYQVELFREKKALAEELPPGSSAEWEAMACQNCRENEKKTTFPCGHELCEFCAPGHSICHEG